MYLCSVLHSGAVILTAVADLLAFGISQAMRDRFGIPHYADNDQGSEAFYAVVRRLFHKIVDSIDPSPLPKNHRIPLTDAAELQAAADEAALADKRSLLVHFSNKILGTSLQPAHALLQETWEGDTVVDATVVGAYAKGLAPDSEVTSTDPDAGWYVRGARHEDPLALEEIAPPPEKGEGGKNTGKAKRRKVKKKLYGFDASLIVARGTSSDGAPLPDGSADPDTVPALIIAFALEKPSCRPGEVAVKALLQVDSRYPRGYLAGDRLYNGQRAEVFQLPIRALGYAPVYDYTKDQLGVQGSVAGAQLVEGSWYCPSMPAPLVTATIDFLAKRIDKDTWIKRIRLRATYLLMPKEAADDEGHRRMMCPAEARRVQCILKPHTMGTGIHLPLVDPAPSPTKPDRICTKRSVTIPPQAGASQWQATQYGGDEWQRVYFRLRNAIEGINGFGKDPLHERMEAAGTRRVRGIAAQTVLLAFQLAHVNRRKLASWADAVALHGNRPRRHPTRRRKTLPIGSWAPKGHIKET